MVEQQIRTVLPRKPNNTHDSVVTLEYSLPAPPGYVLADLEINVRAKVTTTPDPATNRCHKLFRSINVRNEQGSVLQIQDSDTLPMACVISQALKETEQYMTTPRSTDVCRNPAIAAAATDYYGIYKLHAPLPGTVFDVALELRAASDALPSTTAIASSYGVTAVWERNRPGLQRYVFVTDLVNATSAVYTSISKGGMFASDSFSDDASAVTFGNSLDASSLAQMEDQFNDRLRGLATDSTTLAPDTNTKPVYDPATGADVYGILGNLVRPSPVAVTLSSVGKVGYVLYAQSGTAESVIASRRS